MSPALDLLVVGGGINGAGIARDAAGRGLRTLLAERGDYAGATSSASSKLIHGGLRYLEQGALGLVRESLAEREVVLRIAPHIAHPLRFLLPVVKGRSRPAWLLQLGLALYDRLGSRATLPASGRLAREESARVPSLRREGLQAVLHYPDCWVDDARLVLETLLDARARGADVANRREVVAVEPVEGGFAVTLSEGGARRTVQTRALINATGPWANRVLERLGLSAPRLPLRLVRGSHIVIPSPVPGERDAYTLQNADGRVVFVLPWLERFRILGTTDVAHEADPAAAACSDAERDYLLDCYHRYFAHEPEAQDVLWSYAGVRPLIDSGRGEPQQLSRDYAIKTARIGTGLLLTVYGGKLTTHRRLAERVMDELCRFGLAVGPAWTATAPVHGGALNRTELETLAEGGPREIAPATRRRWAFTYGSQTEALFARIAARPGARREIAPGLPEAELEYAVEAEDARAAEDFLYRRTKLFMTLDAAGRRAVEAWFAAGRSRSAESA